MPDTVTYPDKVLAGLKARAALLGATLHRIEDDRGEPAFIFTRWSYTRQFKTPDEVDQLLRIFERAARP